MPEAPSKRSTGRASDSRVENVPPNLLPDVSLLLGDKRQRDLATIIYKMAFNDDFRESFLRDPALALARENLNAAPEVIEAALRVDEHVVDRLTKESREIMTRESALAIEDGVMHLLVVASFLAGALLIELLHHHGDFTTPPTE